MFTLFDLQNELLPLANYDTHFVPFCKIVGFVFFFIENNRAGQLTDPCNAVSQLSLVSSFTWVSLREQWG